VYVSLGTLQNGVTDVFRAVAASAERVKNVQFVLAIGGQLSPEQIGQTPSNVLIVPYAPQIEVLKRASLCITHAGLNTVLESLVNGVPLLAIPITNDQPGVAARISQKGVGLAISQQDVTTSDLSALVSRAIGDSNLRANVSRMQKSILSTDGLAIAAGLLEKALGLQQGVFSPAHMLSTNDNAAQETGTTR
jgi:zeaxanthin glucosyltransferase